MALLDDKDWRQGLLAVGSALATPRNQSAAGNVLSTLDQDRKRQEILKRKQAQERLESLMMPGDFAGSPTYGMSPQQRQQQMAQAAMTAGQPQLAASFMKPAPLPEVQMMDLGDRKVPVDMTSLRQQAAAGTLPPIDQAQGFQKRQSPNRPQINISNPREKKQEEEMGKFLVNTVYKSAQEAGTAAEDQNRSLGMQLNMLDSGVDTGKTARFKAATAAWLSDFGMGTDAINEVAADAEKFKAVTANLVLQEQIKQKGPQTDSDAKRIESTLATIDNTPDANKFIISAAMAQNNYKIDYSAFMRKYYKDSGTLVGAEDAWSAGPGNRSIFDDPALEKWKPAKTGDRPPLSNFILR